MMRRWNPKIFFLKAMTAGAHGLACSVFLYRDRKKNVQHRMGSTEENKERFTPRRRERFNVRK